MKLLCVVTLMCLVVVAKSALDVEMLKNYDFDGLFTNEDKRKAYFDCMLERNPCDDVLQKVKDNVKEIVRTDCGECPQELKERYYRISLKFQKEYPKEHSEFVTKVLSTKD